MVARRGQAVRVVGRSFLSPSVAVSFFSLCTSFLLNLVKTQIAACRNYLDRQKAGTRDLDATSFESLVLESKLTAAESILDWLNRVAVRIAPRRRSTVSTDSDIARSRKGRQ